MAKLEAQRSYAIERADETISFPIDTAQFRIDCFAFGITSQSNNLEIATLINISRVAFADHSTVSIKLY